MLTSSAIRETSQYAEQQTRKEIKRVPKWRAILLVFLAIAGVLTATAVGIGAAMFVLPMMAIGSVTE